MKGVWTLSGVARLVKVSKTQKMAPFLPFFVHKFTNMTSEIPQILPHCALPSGIDVYLSHRGCMDPLWGHQISESFKNVKNDPFFRLLEPVTQAIMAEFQKFWHFWIRGAFLYKISTIWVFSLIWADFRGQKARNIQFM